MNIMDSAVGDTEPLIAGRHYLVRSTTETFIGSFIGIIINHDLNKLGGVYLEFVVNGKAISAWSPALKSIKRTALRPLKVCRAEPLREEEFVKRVECDHLALLKEMSGSKKLLRYSGIIGWVLAAALTWTILYIIRS